MINQNLLDALHIGEEGWSPGMGAITVHTESGSTYEIDNTGWTVGGFHLPNGGQLAGAVYRQSGPIRVNRVLVGLSMEIMRQPPRLGNVVTTSSVISIMERA